MDYRNFDDLRMLLRDANDVQIARMFGVTVLTIRNWRHRFELEPSSVPNLGSTKYTLNRSFFRIIDTPEKAYILGFIAADGCVHQNGKSLSIAIQKSDVDHLYAIRDALGGSNEIHLKKRSGGYQGGQQLAVLNLCGIELVRDLANFGIIPNKTHVLFFPSISHHLESHFIRGLYDGDGHIGKKQFHLVGTPDMITGVQSVIQRHTGCLLVTRMVNNFPQLVGNRRDLAVLTWMYENAPITLKRKREKYKMFWS